MINFSFPLEQNRYGRSFPEQIWTIFYPSYSRRYSENPGVCGENQPKSAVLAGGGYIGLELAENLRELGLDVTIVQRPKQLMNPLDGDMAAFVHAK